MSNRCSRKLLKESGRGPVVRGSLTVGASAAVAGRDRSPTDVLLVIVGVAARSMGSGVSVAVGVLGAVADS
jgi:hypothetical protein